MSSEWYYRDKAGEPAGPLSTAKLKQLLVSSKIPMTTLVWHEGLTAWLPANRVSEFAPPPPTPKPAPPPPRPKPEPVAVAPSNGDDFAQPDLSGIGVKIELDDADLYEVAISSEPVKKAQSTPTKSKSSRVTSAEHLKQVRKSTCYPTFRLVVQICFWFAMLLWCLAIVGALLALFLPDKAQPYPFFAISLIVLGMVLTIASRDASLLLVDIADTLLREHARSRSDE